MPHTLVIVPTYNERENLNGLLPRLRQAVPDAEVLVVDDGSPDGTGQVADAFALADAAVHVLHRPAKAGLAAAYLAGFEWGLRRGFDQLVCMDADGSHLPEQLPALLDAAGDADLVIGSRWVPGGSAIGWPLHRRLLSLGGSWYARLVLGLRQRDVTGGFRVYRADALRRIRTHANESRGYVFQIEMLWRADRERLRITEVPITFTDRSAGASKLSGWIVVEALACVSAWAVGEAVSRIGSPLERWRAARDA